MLEVEIKEDCVEEFIEVMTADASGSRAEAGCLRFDLLRDKENPCKFTSYEVFWSQCLISLSDPFIFSFSFDSGNGVLLVNAFGC